MKNLNIILSILLLAFVVSSCEKEILQLENTDSADSSLIIEWKGKIKNIRIKPRRQKYSFVIKVDDPDGVLGQIKVAVFPTNDIMPTVNEFFPEITSETEDRKTFKFLDQNFEGAAPEGLPFRHQVTFLGFDGEILGTETYWATVQDNDQAELKSLTMKQAGPFADYKIKSKILTEDEAFVNTVTAYFAQINEEGPIVVDTSGDGFIAERKAVNDNNGDVLVVYEWIITYDYADTIETLVVNEEIGVLLEVKSESGEIIDQDLFVVTIEDTAPDGIAIKNTRHRIKQSGKHKLKVKLEGSNWPQASRVVVGVPNANEEGVTEEIELNNIAADNPVFISGPSALNNIIAGSIYVAPVTVFNAANEIIAEFSEEFTVTEAAPVVEANSIFDELRLREGTDATFDYTMIASATSIPADWVAVQALIIPTSGGSDAEPDTVTLNLIAQEPARLIFETEVGFVVPDLVVDQFYEVFYTVLDAEGNEIASWIKEVIGKAEGAAGFTTCMSHGDSPDLFNYSIVTDDPNYQETDVIYVTFGKGNGENLGADCSYPMFRQGAEGDKVTFSGASIQFKDLSQVDEESNIIFSLTPEGEIQSTIRFIDAETIQNLGFYNEETGTWQCEDMCLENSDSCNYYDNYDNNRTPGVLTVHVCHL